MEAAIDASIGEVMDNPIRKEVWLSWMLKSDAKKSKTRSFRLTFSRGAKSDAIQKSKAAPPIRNRLSA